MGHHPHSHSHPHVENTQMRSLLFILGISFSYMILEVIGGLMSGSLALIADAGHMLIDSLSIALSLFALWLAKKPANEKRTYGYHRAEILAALLNGSSLILISIWIFIEAWKRFSNPEPVKGELMMGIAFGGLLVNLSSLLILKKHKEHDANMKGVWLHLLMDTLGSISAIVAGLVIIKSGYTLVDPIASSLIGILILHGAWKLVTECVDVLLESVPKELDATEIRSSISEVKDVLEVHDLHVWSLKSGIYSLSSHVKVKGTSIPAKVLQDITNLIEKKFSISHTTIQLEPEGFAHTNSTHSDCSLG